MQVEEQKIEAMIIDAATAMGATRPELIAKLVERSAIASDPDGHDVGARRAVFALKQRYSDMFLRADDARPNLTLTQRQALRDADSLTVVEAALEPFRHRLAPGTDLVQLARRMLDLAHMKPAERQAAIDRRLSPPSPWLAEFGAEAGYSDQGEGEGDPWVAASSASSERYPRM